MMKLFDFRNKRVCSQETFINLVIENLGSLFFKFGFELIAKEFNNFSSKLVFKRENRYILMLAEQSQMDGNYFEFTIGSDFDDETNSFDDYHISINRLYKITHKTGVSFYSFPLNEKQALKDIQNAKNDFLNCASFYLETDEDLFDKVLKLKGIRK